MNHESSQESARPALVVIGPGKVGGALAIVAARAGWPVAAIGARDVDAARRLASRCGPGVAACGTHEAAGAGGLVLLTVSDGAIAGLARELAGAGAFRHGAVVAHCSGSIASDALSPARDECGCRVASAHPLQTFPTAAAAVDRLGGASFYCEGDEEALAVLATFVRHIGGRYVRFGGAGGDAKKLYHAGAVNASNHLAALVDSSVDLMASAGIAREEALAGLAALVRATVDNVLAMGPAAALTGPIARGEAAVVAGHVAAMRGAGVPREVLDLYLAAGRRTVALALDKGTIDASAARALLDILKER
jgi:predicted short-subunit dehydrogenase-like oxidoreductase (DUF2520 family)